MSRPILRKEKFLYCAPEMREFLQCKHDLLKDADDCERNIKCQEAAAFSNLIRAFESTANFDLHDAENRARNAIIAEEDEALDPLFREYNQILDICPRCDEVLSAWEGLCRCRRERVIPCPNCLYNICPGCLHCSECDKDKCRQQCYLDIWQTCERCIVCYGKPLPARKAETHDYEEEIQDYADLETKLELLDFAEEICADSEVREMMLILA